ncbi:Predicted PurR-regulated permease PerM [Bhargavaea ginsengi]|uniref:Predicted PurR-regulated permease PerM n=1 Tax=Bhargavaea ginsengi TaxID=426757 RepID=A0A1H6XRZ1_9BACL|nr:AI-2E family transporter [Bhargavaea ginsengi]MCM3086401.1 AI-2E family transporter [Bhargavaea ginsengi]SEJ31799.1 Predicted PurR-regulated permease PerM [Bhargavaea ginsengi]
MKSGIKFQNGLKTYGPVAAGAALCFLLPQLSLAILAGYIAAPAVSFMKERLRIPLPVAAIVAELLILVSAAFALLFALQQIIIALPAIRAALSSMHFEHPVASEWLIYAETALTAAGDRLIDSSAGMVQTAFSRVFSFILFLLAFYFSLYESARDRYWFLAALPAEARKKAKGMFREGGSLFGTFLFVEIRLILLTFGILSIGLAALGFGSPVGRAFLIALADSLPFLGVGIFLIPMAAYYLLSGSPLLGTALIILYVFVMLTRQIAESRMWAATFQLRPSQTFFITAASILLFGLAGIILSPILLFVAARIKKMPAFSG